MSKKWIPLVILILAMALGAYLIACGEKGDKRKAQKHERGFDGIEHQRSGRFGGSRRGGLSFISVDIRARLMYIILVAQDVGTKFASRNVSRLSTLRENPARPE